MRFFLQTQGCKINQYESHALREAWTSHGHIEASDPSMADVICLNGCAVTERAVRDVCRALRRLHRSRPEAALVLTGCAAAVLAESRNGLPEGVRLVPQEQKPALASSGGNGIGRLGLEDCPPGNRRLPELSISGYPRTRSVLKVQDGCSHGCTYCIVPRTRGPAVSRHPAAILAEAERLAENGFAEIVISGINLAQYQRPLQGFLDFWDLLAWLDRRLADGFGQSVRLRLSSLDPGQLNEKAREVLAAGRLICPHLHISIQSGSRRILRRMGRDASRPDGLPVWLDSLAPAWPLFGLGGDFLVGFPGESSHDFRQTVELVQALPFSYGHVFPYSPRPGTAAANQPDQVPEAVKKERSRLLRRLLKEKREHFIGRALRELESVEVVPEGNDPGQGRCGVYLPCRFDPEDGAVKIGEPTAARPIGRTEDGLLVEQLQKP